MEVCHSNFLDMYELGLGLGNFLNTAISIHFPNQKTSARIHHQACSIYIYSTQIEKEKQIKNNQSPLLQATKINYIGRANAMPPKNYLIHRMPKHILQYLLTTTSMPYHGCNTLRLYFPGLMYQVSLSGLMFFMEHHHHPYHYCTL